MVEDRTTLPLSPRLTRASLASTRQILSRLASRSGHMLTRRLAVIIPASLRSAPPLWTTFALAWLLVLAMTMGLLVRAPTL